MNADKLLAHMKLDKKTVAGQMTFILPKNIGEVVIRRGINSANIEKVLR
jgi:3-dehydroquinate synthetase